MNESRDCNHPEKRKSTVTLIRIYVFRHLSLGIGRRPVKRCERLDLAVGRQVNGAKKSS